jgi:hypothetical protein
MPKDNICKHCRAVNSHFSFQCSLVRKPIQPKIGDIVGNKRVVKVQPSWENKPLITKKQKAIPVFSEKHKKKLAEYRILRDQFMKEHPMCQASLICCTGLSSDLHHKAGRVGKLLTDTRYFMAVCRSCHSWIETHTQEAKDLEFSLSRTDK